MNRRRARATSTPARRALVVLAGAALGVLISAGPALAASVDRVGPLEGADSESGITGGEAVLLFVLIPLAICLLLSLLHGGRSFARTERYRPGKVWSAVPVWFAGPPEPVAAVEAATQAGGRDAMKGGASGHW